MKNGATTRAQRGTFSHYEYENTKRFSSSVVFADIGVDDAIGTVEGVTDGGQTSGQTGGQTGGQTLLTEAQLAVYNILKRGNMASRQSIADNLGINPSGVQSIWIH